MTIKMIGMYQFSQSRRPLTLVCWAQKPRPAQIANTAAQAPVSTWLT
jgi:hypothetical protein